MSNEKNCAVAQTQLGIYLDCTEQGVYNGHFLLTLDNSTNMKRLATSIEKAVAAHPSIFTHIAERDGEIMQEFEAENYTQSVEKISENELQKRLSELVAEPLKLHGGNLFRFNLIETENKNKNKNISFSQRTTLFLTGRRQMFF